RYILQRRTSTPTGSSGHDESSSLYAELRLINSKRNLKRLCLGLMREIKVKASLDQTLLLKVHLEEPASSSGTLSSLQHLTKDLSFGDLFFSDKPLEADNDKANAEIEAESMV
nr:hypothetical protein [Tanacetum cinerariifolium]